MSKEVIQRASDLLDRVKQMQTAVNLEKKIKEINDLDEQMAQADFWQTKNSAVIAKKLGDLKNEYEKWKTIEKQISDCRALAEADDEDKTVVLTDEINIQLDEFEKQLEILETDTMLSGEYDSANAIMSINAGAGGDDSQDWAEMLLRMYVRFIDKQNWKYNILNKSDGQIAGIKSITLEVSGYNAFGYLKSESGVHRLVRLSPFDADHARHTSFAMVEVVPQLAELNIEIKEDDLRIDVFRSSGNGGQSVNTTDSAVRITHVPTGIVAVCQNERSQLQNKEKARQYLFGKLASYYQTQREEERQLLRGELTEAAWGNQIRSYVLHPYQLVKDHRTKFEVSDPDKVLNGDVFPFIEQYLKSQVGK